MNIPNKFIFLFFCKFYYLYTFNFTNINLAIP